MPGNQNPARVRVTYNKEAQMAKTDQYDRMNTNQLEAEASQRGIPLEEFQALRNNEERAQRLRDHDAATQASTEQAQANAEQARQAQEQAQAQAQGQADQQAQQQAQQDQARQAQDAQAAQQQQAQDAQAQQQQNQAQASTTGDGVTERLANEPTRQAPGPDDQGPYDTAPYTSPGDQQNRVNAATGNVTAPPAYDEADAPPVGGQNTPTIDGRDPDLNPDQQ